MASSFHIPPNGELWIPLVVLDSKLPMLFGINPLNWSTATFIALAAGTLLLHLLIPRSQRWSIRLLREVLLVVPAVLLYFLVRGLVDARSSDAEANALRVIDLERLLGIFWEPELQQKILASDLIVTLVNWVYVWAHWPVIVLVSVWLVVFHQTRFTVYRNAMFISGAIGLLIFALFPVAPPRFMEGIGVVDTVTLRSESYRILQPPALTNPFAAMPSLHFGWNLVMGIALFQVATRMSIRLIGLLTPIAMFLAVILTANHYILDAVAGGVLVVVSLIIAMNLSRIRARAQPLVSRVAPWFHRWDIEGRLRRQRDL